MKATRGAGYDVLLDELTARVRAGRPVTLPELADAIAALEVRQADAFCLRKWGIELNTLLDLRSVKRLDLLDQMSSTTFRMVGCRLGVSHIRAQALVDRAAINVLGWLTS